MENSGLVSNDELDLRLYWSILRKKAGLIVLTVFLFGLTGFWISNLLPPIYEASSTLMVSENSALQTNEYNAILTSERLARTYAQIITAQPILEAVRSSLGLVEEVDELKERIQVSLITNTQLIQVKVQSPDPGLAQRIANALVEHFINDNVALQQSRFADSKTALANQIAEQQVFMSQIQSTLDSLSQEEHQSERSRLEGLLSQYRQSYTQLLQSYEQLRLAEAQSTSNVIQVEPAAFPREPVSPKILVNTILASVLGAVFSIGFVLLQATLDNSIKGAEDIKSLGLPVLAFIARTDEEDALITATNPRSPISESFRSLRTNIHFASVDSQLKTIAVTSSVQGEGKTTVGANLAFVMSQLGNETIVVDADLRRPRLHKLFELSNKKGLANLFVNKELGKAFPTQLQETKFDRLKVLASGGIPPNPSELISSIRMASILRAASGEAGVVIIDAPPVLPVTDAIVLAQKVDGVIVVIVPGETTLPMARQTIESLRQVNANILGVVLNNVDLHSAYFAAYRNGYQYHYDQES